MYILAFIFIFHGYNFRLTMEQPIQIQILQNHLRKKLCLSEFNTWLIMLKMIPMLHLTYEAFSKVIWPLTQVKNFTTGTYTCLFITSLNLEYAYLRTILLPKYTPKC